MHFARRYRVTDAATDIRINAEPMKATSMKASALPAGIITLRVYAVDKLGAQSVAATTTVNVSSFAAQIDTANDAGAVAAVTAAAATLIATASAVDNPSGVLMAVECAANVMGTIAATDVSDAESVARRQTLRSTLFESVKKASLQMTYTASAIEQRASSIEKLSAKPLELSYDIQDDMVTLLQSWSDTALNGTVPVTSAATTKQVGALSNLLRAKQVTAAGGAGATTSAGVDGSAISTAVHTMGAVTLKSVTGTGFTRPIAIETEYISMKLQRGRPAQLSASYGVAPSSAAVHATEATFEWGSETLAGAVGSNNENINAQLVQYAIDIHNTTVSWVRARLCLLATTALASTLVS